MDVVTTIIQIGIRSLFVLSPVAVAGLAYRRLALSRSGNAWIYACIALTATLTAIALLPWAVGVGQISWLPALLSLLCPFVWVGVVLICDAAQGTKNYDSFENDQTETPGAVFMRHIHAPKTHDPLMLERPEWPDAPEAVFIRRETPQTKIIVPTDPVPSVRDVISIVREMRGNASSEPRRPRLLPPPGGSLSLKDMPFIR